MKCDDLREATFTTPEGTFDAKEAQQDIPQLGKVELMRLDGGVWYINRETEAGTC